MRALEKERAELNHANDILHKASAYFDGSGGSKPVQTMMTRIDNHRAAAGVEAICRVLQIAPLTYYDPKAKARDARRRRPQYVSIK